MKILLPRQECNFFTGEHGLCFAGYCRGAQPEGWRFGTPTAPTESKPRPSPKIGPRLRGATVGDTTFRLVAEGARRQDVRNNEADAKSKRGDGPSSWIFGSEEEDTRRPGDTSVVTSNQWAPRSSSIRTKRAAWSCGPF